MENTLNEVEDLLTKYNIDSRNCKLRNYYEADNIWRTLGIERDENSHSSFWAWLLGKDISNINSPLHKFLNLIIRLKKDDNEAYKELKRGIMLNRLRLRNAQIENERTISSLTSIRFNDRLDIYANCELTGIGDYSKLEIFIENKIHAEEGTYKLKKNEKFQPTLNEEEYRKKYQTERYYYACSKKNRLRKEPFDYENTIQLFVFLTTKREQKPKDDEHFVTVTYQDLVEYVLEPYLIQEDIDEHTLMTVKEYLRILGNPINNHTIMATTSEEKELLVDFYKRNEDLFRRALEAMIDSAEDSDEEGEYKTMLESIKKSKVRRFFKINGDGKFKMYEVIAEFVKFLREKNKDYDEIEDIIKDYSDERRQHIATTEEDVFRGKEKGGFESSYNNETFYVTKEWGYDKNSRKNFSGILQGINKNYKDFKVEEIS